MSETPCRKGQKAKSRSGGDAWSQSAGSAVSQKDLGAEAAGSSEDGWPARTHSPLGVFALHSFPFHHSQKPQPFKNMCGYTYVCVFIAVFLTSMAAAESPWKEPSGVVVATGGQKGPLGAERLSPRWHRLC